MTIDKTKNKQVLITLPIELVEEIENYWHNQELPNRNEAIRELIRHGLKIESNK